MREHGFMKQFPIVRLDDDVVIDGLARQLAAATLNLEVEYLKYGSDKDRAAARRRDTPLNRVLVTLHSNAVPGLDSDILDAVYERVATVTRRPWSETATDLALTADWRRAVPAEYSPVFEVIRLPYRKGDEAKIQVTPDNKVMLRSLVEAGGLASYKIATQLSAHVPIEKARSVHSGGRKADFARAEDLIKGIAAMQAERRATKRKVDPEWEQILDWLVDNFATQSI